MYATMFEDDLMDKMGNLGGGPESELLEPLRKNEDLEYLSTLCSFVDKKVIYRTKLVYDEELGYEMFRLVEDESIDSIFPFYDLRNRIRHIGGTTYFPTDQILIMDEYTWERVSDYLNEV